MRDEILYTGIQCKSLDESLRFFCDYCGMHKVESFDSKIEDYKEELETRVVPKLFGFTGHGRVKFRSQLIKANDTNESFYQLFEWVSPKWVDNEPYNSSNHVGAYRSQTAVDDIEYLRRRQKEYGAKFVCEETQWWGHEYSSTSKPDHFEPAMITLDPNGFRMQTRQVEGLPGEKVPFHPVRMIRHREINVSDLDATVRFYHDVIGMHIQGCKYDDPIPEFNRYTELPKLNPDHFSQEYVDYMRNKCLVELFNYSKDANVEFKACMMNCEGSVQNLDLFQWINPAAYGRAYSALNHIGYQRLCFTVSDIHRVQEQAKASGADIVCDLIDIPSMVIPGGLGVATKAMSLRDPDGVFLIILGE